MGAEEPVTDAADPRAERAARLLVAEACRRAGLVWVTVAGRYPRGLWHVWHDEAVHLVVGRDEHAGEQQAPGLATAGEVVVTVPSKDTGGRLVTFTAAPRLLAPGGPGYDEAAAALQAARLNGPDAATTLAAWRERADVVRLEPTGRVLEQPGSMSTSSHAAPPPPTSATTAPVLPLALRRRRRRR